MNAVLKAFLNIGKQIGESMIPGIAGIEQSITSLKSGGDKREAVLNIVKSSLQITDELGGSDFSSDPDFQEGMKEVNDGYVKIMNTIKKKHSGVNANATTAN